MNITDPGDPLLPPPSRRRRRRSARERQRRGPMFGCMKAIFWLFGVGFVLMLLIVGGGWWYLGSTSFAGLVKARIEETLQNRLGRDVTIGRVEIVRTRPQKIILHNVRIDNAPGGLAPEFATVSRVQITGNIESFWSRRVRVGRVDIIQPNLWFEILPDGTHNFPKWKSGPKSPREIVHLDIGTLYITNGAFSFNDRKHQIVAVAHDIDSNVKVTRAEGLYEGLMNSPLVRVRLQDYEPFDLNLRGGFRYTPGVLALRSIALKGRGIEAFISGKLDPLTEARYDLDLQSRIELERVKEIFRVEPLLEGQIVLDTRLRGKAGDFRLTGGWSSPGIAADVYELANVKGRLDVTGNNMTVEVDRGGYGGGTIGAHYVLSKYAEPYPMTVDLRYNGIALEQLFNDWGVENTGLRGAATGNLTYRWNKEKILEGAGEGTARLAKNATAFSDARYPVPLAGSADFALNNGVVTFRRAELDTDASHISLTGSLKIEDIVTDLRMTIRSNDFSELDRVAYNFAHSAGKEDFELLGLGGSGTISGTVRGPIERPQVVATVNGSAIRYNEVLLGDGDLALRYNGDTSTLTFDRAQFTDAGGRLVLTGTIVFPDRGPGPRFDIAVDAAGYPTQRAIDAVGLDMQIGAGLATGKLVVTGTPESGRATFAGLTIRRADATLALNGTINWLPGEGNVRFDLDIAATNFPVSDIAAFLDFADIPVTGDLTGTLKIAGAKESLEGAGSVTIRNGAIMGEPIDLASANIVFTEGRMRATNVLVRAPAGEVRGEAELDLANERFSYNITSQSLDLSRFQILASLRDLLGGRIVLKSTGAGTFTNPELVVDATLEGATLRGLTLPEGSAPPSLYIAIRNGTLIVRGAIADIVSIEGEGTVGENLAVDGLVRVTIHDIARAAAMTAATATIPASGNMVIDMRLGGRLTPLEALVIEGTVPTFNLKIAEHEFTAPEPLRVTLRNGRIEFDSFVLRRTDSMFAVTGFAELTGAKRLDVDVRGLIDAALLQLFAPDVRAEGSVDVAISVDGTVTAPNVVGTAELRDAEVKFAGFPQLIDEINGTLRFRGDRIEIESMRATVGGGQIVAGGSVALNGMQLQNVRITLQGTDVSIRYYEGVTIESNFTLLLSGDLERMLLQGDVDVTRALYFRDFDVQQTLLNVILARNRVTPVTAATWQDRIGLRIRLNAPGTLAVENNIADVNASAALDVTGTVANPVILGEVTLDEGGRVRIQGVDYRLVRGTIGFQNPFRIDPFFDVTLEGTVAGFGASEVEGGPFEVTINLTGTLDRLTPSITSDPPASDITLFSILGFGGLGGANGQTGGAGLLGQSLLYQSLSSLIGSTVFPFVDSFAYDPGSLDTSGGASPKVTFEKRLSNKIRFLLVYNLDNQQSRQVVEWLVNPTWTLQLTRDEADEYRLDARFRRRYEAHWRWGGEDEDELASAAVVTASAPAEGAAATTVEATPVPRPPPVTAVNTAAADNRPITQVNFRADAPFNTEAIAREVTLQPGQLVTIRELQSSIKNLYATGNFRDVRVDAAPVDAGVVLTFSLFLHFRIDDIGISGLSRSDETRARRELTVRRGEILSLDAVNDSAAAIEEMLIQNGFLQATVDPETNFDRARNVADVQFVATPGPLAKVASVLIEGNPSPFTTAELIERMSRKPGTAFKLEEAREDADRMKNFLVRRNYRRADVDFLGHTYDEASQTVALRYRAVAGPLVEVAVTGVERRAVRRWLPFGRNQEYSEDVVDRAADRIVEGLQERGHYEATVDTESSLENNVWTTTFNVSPGPRYRLADVRFSGNIRVNEDELHGIVATTPRGGIRRFVSTLFRRPTGVTRTQLSDDRDAIESFYRLQGFSQATAGEPVVQTSADGTMSVVFPVTEGPQTLISELLLEGNEKIVTDDLPRPQLEQGGPLNPQLLHDDITILQTFYANRGYVEVQVTPRITVSEDQTSATVAYVIAEGPQVNVDEITVRGNTYTDRDVVLRRAELRSGQPFSYTSMLEAQRELYRLGIFQRVDVQATQTDATVADRDVVIQVEEGRNLTLTGSVGIRADRTGVGEPTELHERVAVAAAHRNLFGSGRYLGLEIVAGRDEQEAFLTYREPFISRWNVPVQLQIFQSDDSTRAGTKILQRGTSIEATKVARLQTRWSLRYEYKISDCYDGDLCTEIDQQDEEVPIEGLERSLLNIQISSITPTFFWDTRDDIIDPHRGFFTSASVEYAFPLFAADAGFFKEFLQGAYYIPVTERTVIALSGRLGLIQRYARSVDRIDEETGEFIPGGALLPVPLSERFTAGGETTHRAFPLDFLGDLCRDDTPLHKKIDGCEATLYAEFNELTGERTGPILPLGGSSLLLFNAEYRFPLFSTLGGAVFADIGNVYAGSKIDFSNLRYGAGFGFRYLSPVGPLRIDLALPIDKKWYEDSFQYFITLGYAF
ncbi:MAG TPA: translocation/assembly module TamB domain-containing protein [Thermoanaerobaculia bacterium]|nr:translocation/assembly module TamB domain-containing protein [Thermoanaerobaculia bacterium]